ncbi:hypothetical protein ABFV99_00475 [Cytobacillus horneckiae]|uniref:hypothetical protein n=1 Tax=Cytobacillus horneckiae TaxID=549687 RepID=UPI0034CE0756
MKTEKLLNTIGIIFVALGILGGIIGWSIIDHENYEIATEVYEELWDNPSAETSFYFTKSIWVSEVYSLISVALVSVIGGFILIGIGHIIKNQRELIGQLKVNKEVA